MKVSVFGFSWAGALLWGASAFGATGGRLVYAAPVGCATRAEFEASVAQRGGHFDGAEAPEVGRELRIAITRTASGFLGTFQTTEPAGASAIRELHGATCSEVVAALEVVSAIALRGDDESQRADSKLADSTPSSVAAEPVSSTEPRSVPKPRPARDEGRLRASGVAGSRRVEVSAGTLRFDGAHSMTVFVGGELGLLPSQIVPRYDLTISSASFVTTPEGKSYIAGVIPRIRSSYLGKSTYRAADGASVSAQGIGIGMGLCWSPAYDTRGFVALLCVEYAIGLLRLRSSGPGVVGSPFFMTASEGAVVRRPALQTGGLSFETEYRFGSVLHLALKLGIDAPLQPVTAERLDGSQIFHSSPVLGYGMLGAGLHF